LLASGSVAIGLAPEVRRVLAVEASYYPGAPMAEDRPPATPAPDRTGASDPRVAPDPLDPAFAPDAHLPSLWPQTTRPADLASTGFGATHFDLHADERRHGDAPDEPARMLCAPSLALRVVVLVQVACAAPVLLAAGDRAQWVALQAGVSFAALAGALLWLVAACALDRSFAARGASLRAAWAWGLGAVAALAGAAPIWALRLFAGPEPWQPAGVALAGAALAAVAWNWLDLRAKLSRPAEASARLAELQSRIRPHFLFNALNTALALVREDPDRAEQVLEDLAALFREALAESGASVSLAEEVDLAQRYLAIEQIRFGSRLAVHWDIDPHVGRARVPPLVLQPLVENAVRHGVEHALGGGRVEVKASARGGHAVVLVSNTLGDEPSRPGRGMALANVRERLRLLHDMAAQCDAWREGGRFHARIVVPME
jgi:two-component system sensor histidine kinase AlgZ